MMLIGTICKGIAVALKFVSKKGHSGGYYLSGTSM